MKIEGKIWILKYLVICLAVIFAQKADDLLFSDYNITINGRTSEIKTTETNLIMMDYSSFSAPEAQCRIPRQTNFTNSFRTPVQAHRHNTGNTSRNGFTLTKSGKSMNVYTTSLFLISIINFPSGMKEANHHLIGLRKLII